MKFLGNLSTREKWYAATAIISLGLFSGCIVSRFLGGWPIDWSMTSGAGAVLTLILAVVGYFDNRHGKHLEHRAYIAIFQDDPVEFTINPKAPSNLVVPFPVKFKVRNYGRTPALCTIIEGHAQVGTEYNGLPVEADGQSNIAVHPGGGTDLNVMVYLSRDKLDKLRWMQVAIFISIGVRYKDVFGGKHFTREGFKITGESIEFKGVEQWDFGSTAT